MVLTLILLHKDETKKNLLVFINILESFKQKLSIGKVNNLEPKKVIRNAFLTIKSSALKKDIERLKALKGR